MRGRVLIIAGSDSGGGAGIQADIKTVSMLDAYAATAITALTAQNTEGVFGVLPIPPDFVRRQIEVVLDDIGADAIKTGMLHDLPVIETIAAVLSERAAGIQLVVDPVMVAKGGARLIDPAALDGLKQLLIARAEILDSEFAGSRNSVRYFDRQRRRNASRRPKPIGAGLPGGAGQRRPPLRPDRIGRAGDQSKRSRMGKPAALDPPYSWDRLHLRLGDCCGLGPGSDGRRGGRPRARLCPARDRQRAGLGARPRAARPLPSAPLDLTR